MKILRQFGISFSLFLLSLFWVCLPKPLFRDQSADILLAADSTLLGARISNDGQWRFPEITTVPERLEKSILCFEDKRFHYHPGIDLLSLMRALRLNLQKRRIVSGGSTITMQLIRLSRKNQPRTFYEKLIEAVLSLRAEIAFSKQEILALYLSHAPFGGNIVGVEAASWRYFNRPVSDLSWAESAMLAVLPNSPALIHPGRNRGALKKKRDFLLLKLYERGIIDQITYELSIEEPIPTQPHALPRVAPHLLDYFCKQGIKGRIPTTIDSHFQRLVLEIANRYAENYRSNYVHNMGILVADVQSGEVLAYVGNPSASNSLKEGMQVDMIRGERSTGSLLKPLLYAAMLDAGHLMPHSLVPDIPLYVNGFAPSNYDKEFHGAVPASQAVSRSLNVPLVRMLMRYDCNRFYELLKDCGMNTLYRSASHYGLSLILGGAEGTLWNMTSIYASLARYMQPEFGETFTRTPFSLEKEREVDAYSSPISRGALWYAFEAMSEVNRPEEESDWQAFSGMKKIAWKTGTSYGARDAWAIGFTPRHIVGVWVGNASGEGRAGLSGIGYAAPILFDVFSALPSSGWFEKPEEELREVVVCRQSGFKASIRCPQTDTLSMPRAAIGSSPCPYHRTVLLDKSGSYRVNAECYSVFDMRQENRFVLPPAQELYYRRYNPSYEPLPPLAEGCSTSEDKIDVIYPTHDMRIYLPVGFSGKQENFVFKAAYSRPGAHLFWHINERFCGETEGNHQLALSLDPGEYLLTLMDESGLSRKIRFFIVRKSK